MTAAPEAPERPLLRAAGLSVLFAGAVLGAVQMQFLCDDAYITFRYVANAREGLGLVWNPPPFAPVEGYTGFLWALLLWATWSWSGVEPPAAANTLSLLCGLGQLAVVAAAALRVRGRDGARLPGAVALLAVAAVAGNRTFLAWLGSGLETALFNLGFLTWVVLAFRSRAARGPRWLACWSAAAAVAALTRPDGYLCVAATLAVAAWNAPWRRAHAPRWRWWAGLLPLLAVAAHLCWRRAFYGEWLPNTYYAKVAGAWPEAGLRYLSCFLVEHGGWLWLPLCALWLLAGWRGRTGLLRALPGPHLPAAVAVGAVLFHAGYYTLVVGGDHFEYRVYSQLVPLGVLAAAAMAARLPRRGPGAGARRGALPAAALAGLLLANGVGWAHLWLTRDMPWHGFRPVAAQLPAPLQPLGRWFDRQQAWLRLRLVCLRTNHHALFLARARRTFPRRMEIAGAEDPYPAYATGSVGLAGWSLPGAVLVDLHGLNDWVVARTPIRDFGTPPGREQLRAVFAAGDTDRDGWLDEAELRAVLVAFAPGADRRREEEAEYLTAVLLAIYGRQRPGALAAGEAEAIGGSLAGARAMAHERAPPPGYVEELSPNVVVEDGAARALPRELPLTAERVAAFEARWRAWVAAR